MKTAIVVNSEPTILGRRGNQSNPQARGNKRKTAAEGLAMRGTGAVVAMLIVTTELPLPRGIEFGLKPHVVSAGKLEQENVTLLGNVPVVGATSRL
jgi:hypothetical protein